MGLELDRKPTHASSSEGAYTLYPTLLMSILHIYIIGIFLIGHVLVPQDHMSVVQKYIQI
jgi:hypothetical protein